MKITRKRLAVATGVLAVAGAWFWIRTSGTDVHSARDSAGRSEANSSRAVKATTPGRAYGEIGRWQRYALDLHISQSVDLLALGGSATGPQRQSVDLRFRGEVEIEVVAVRKRRSLVRLTMPALASLDMEITGMGTEEDDTAANRLRAAMLSSLAFAEVSERGEFVRIHTGEAPGPVAGLWHQVVSGLQTTLPARGTPRQWSAPERTTMGMVASQYRRKRATDSQWKLYRDGSSYLSVKDVASVSGEVSGGSEITWDTRGWLHNVQTNTETTLLALGGRETTSAQTAFDARLHDTGVREVEPTLWPVGGALLGQVDSSAGTDEAMIARRAAGWDRDRVFGAIAMLTAPASAEGFERMRAITAFLTLNPEVCEELGDTMGNVGDAKTRDRILDLLVDGNNERCQAAAAKVVVAMPLESPSRNMRLQRIAITHTPTIATASLLRQEMLLAENSADTDREFSAGTGLGAIVEMLDMNGRRDEADEFAEEVSARLADAGDVANIQAYVRAAGNMRRPEVLPAMLVHLDHASPAVRLMLAATLDKFTERIAIDARLVLATDAMTQVQARALRGWVTQAPDLLVIARLTNMVREGVTQAKNAAILVEVIRSHQRQHPTQYDKLAAAMIETMDLDGDIVGALNRLRARGATMSQNVMSNAASASAAAAN